MRRSSNSICAGSSFSRAVSGDIHSRAIDFRKRLHFPAARRPFHLEQIADERVHIEIAFHREGGHALAAFLRDLAEGHQRSIDVGAEFFAEFAARAGFIGFVAVWLAFGNRPRTGIAASPKRSAGMREQHFEFSLDASIQKNTAAAFGHASMLAECRATELRELFTHEE